MQPINKLVMFYMAVSDMQRAKGFYTDKLGLKVTNDFRQADDRWWVSLSLPEGGVTITLSTYYGNTKPGTMNLYFATKDIDKAHEDLSNKGVKVNEVKDDLFGPGSGVKWFDFEDPDGNQVKLAQA